MMICVSNLKSRSCIYLVTSSCKNLLLWGKLHIFYSSMIGFQVSMAHGFMDPRLPIGLTRTKATALGHRGWLSALCGAKEKLAQRRPRGFGWLKNGEWSGKIWWVVVIYGYLWWYMVIWDFIELQILPFYLFKSFLSSLYNIYIYIL